LSGQVEALRLEKEKLLTQCENSKVQYESLRTELEERILALEGKLSSQSQSVSAHKASELALTREIEQLKTAPKSEAANDGKQVLELQAMVTTLQDEIEGYNATIVSLKNHIEDTESREIEHEKLKERASWLLV